MAPKHRVVYKAYRRHASRLPKRRVSPALTWRWALSVRWAASAILEEHPPDLKGAKSFCPTHNRNRRLTSSTLNASLCRILGSATSRTRQVREMIEQPLVAEMPYQQKRSVIHNGPQPNHKRRGHFDGNKTFSDTNRRESSTFPVLNWACFHRGLICCQASSSCCRP